MKYTPFKTQVAPALYQPDKGGQVCALTISGGQAGCTVRRRLVRWKRVTKKVVCVYIMDENTVEYS